MKTKSPTLPLRNLCFIEIYRNGKYAGKGIFVRRAGVNKYGQKQARITNEHGLIEWIPTNQIKRVGG